MKNYCQDKEVEKAQGENLTRIRTEPQPTINQIKSLFTQLLTQIQATHEPNSPLYQKALKEQKEALTILENAPQNKQEKYLSLIRQIEPLLTKPNLSLEEQTKLKQTGEKMDEMVEKLRKSIENIRKESKKILKIIYTSLLVHCVLEWANYEKNIKTMDYVKSVGILKLALTDAELV
ncbi:2329_t:CDS:2, partial [Funneliformis geosporum]